MLAERSSPATSPTMKVARVPRQETRRTLRPAREQARLLNNPLAREPGEVTTIEKTTGE
jgi:hypothetical protein